MPVTLWLCLIAFLAGLIQGLAGFGVMLVALPLMAMLIDIKTAVPLILLLALVMNAILVCQLARHIEAGKWLPLLIASLPGVPVGVYFLKTVEPRWLELLVGAVVIASTAATWLRGTPGAELKKPWAWAAGLSAGFLGASIGASGPPVIIYTALQPWSKHQTKATLVTFFTIGGAGILALQFFFDLVTPAVLRNFAYCLLPLLGGVLTGMRLFDRIDETYYKRAVQILLLALGVVMLAKGAAVFGG